MAGHRRVLHQIKEVPTLSRQATSEKVIYRDSRCPGCHGRITLRYRREKVGDSYRFHLLSPMIAHRMCETALEEIRATNPAWFRREINAQITLQETPPLYRRKKSKS